MKSNLMGGTPVSSVFNILKNLGSSISDIKIYLIIGGIAASLLTGAFFYVKSLRNELVTINAQLQLKQLEIDGWKEADQIKAAKHKAQLSKIKDLEKNRRANELLLEPFILDVDLFTNNSNLENNSGQDSLADRANKLNGNLNRLLQQTSP